jgi:hypothetical protein
VYADTFSRRWRKERDEDSSSQVDNLLEERIQTTRERI